MFIVVDVDIRSALLCLTDIHVVELYNLLCPMWSGGVYSWIIVQSAAHLGYEITHLANGDLGKQPTQL